MIIQTDCLNEGTFIVCRFIEFLSETLNESYHIIGSTGNAIKASPNTAVKQRIEERK
ncbi:MAG: hypothetical protein LBE57_02750 [Methanosarcinales archaeon]|nr:hypothetical protein [Methanosarcinales archaeon]